jgi:hypothetical protein
MSPTLLTNNVQEIAATAGAQERKLREKHNIKTVSLLEHQDFLREERLLATPLVEYLEQLDLHKLK